MLFMDKDATDNAELISLHNQMVDLYVPTIALEEVTQVGFIGEHNCLAISRALGALGFSQTSIDAAVKDAFRVVGKEV